MENNEWKELKEIFDDHEDWDELDYAISNVCRECNRHSMDYIVCPYCGEKYDY